MRLNSKINPKIVSRFTSIIKLVAKLNRRRKTNKKKIKKNIGLHNCMGLCGARHVKKTLQDRKTLPRVQLIGCQGVKLFLPKYCFKFCKNLNGQNLSF